MTIQAQIDLLRKLQDDFITHDLGVIAEIAGKVAVMFRGKVVEYGPVLDIFENPQHPYTKGLLNCRPSTPSRCCPRSRTSWVLDAVQMRSHGRRADKELIVRKMAEGEGTPVLAKDLKVWFPVKGACSAAPWTTSRPWTASLMCGRDNPGLGESGWQDHGPGHPPAGGAHHWHGHLQGPAGPRRRCHARGAP